MVKFYPGISFLFIKPLLLQHFNQCRYLPHVGDGEFFESDEVVGVEGGSHDGGRIAYLDVVAKGKRPTAKTMMLSYV